MKAKFLGSLIGTLPLLGTAWAAPLSTPTTMHAHPKGDVSRNVQRDRGALLDRLRDQSRAAGDDLRVLDGAFGMPRYLSGVLSGPKPSDVALDRHVRRVLRDLEVLFPVPADQLVLTRTTEDAAGGAHLRFEQSFRGVPVFGAKLNVHVDSEGVVRAINASTVADLNLDVRPTLSEDDVYARVNDWMLNKILDIPGARLTIFPMRAGSRLVYQVPVALDVGPRILFIDAHGGELVHAEDPRRDGQTTGSGIDALGNEIDDLAMWKGPFFSVDVSFMLRPYIQGAGRGRYNLVDKSTPDLGDIYTLTSNETYLADIDFVTSNDDSFDDLNNPAHPSGVSAHQYYRDNLEFYWNHFGRYGLDDDGLSITSFVEVNGIPGYELECNAGWIGYGFNFMIFGMGGDCYGYQLRPFSASLDVIGHELNHGVIEFTINLGYNHESGALNESLADVFGVLVEADYEPHDWLIGEDLFIDPEDPETAFRNFEKPADDSVLLAQPDSMSVFATYPLSYDAGGVHFNSGITNKAFQLMVDGGTYRGVTVPKLADTQEQSLRIAGDLFYDVENSERISNISQFIDLRDALVDAAEQLYPSKIDTIRAAFDAVGIVNELYPTASDDLAEPNDYPALAVSIGTNSTSSQYIWARNDVDVYAVELNAGQTLRVDLTDLAFDARLGLYSVGPEDTLMEETFSDNEGNADESIQYTATGSGVVYLEILPNFNEGSRTQPYTLSTSLL